MCPPYQVSSSPSSAAASNKRKRTGVASSNASAPNSGSRPRLNLHVYGSTRAYTASTSARRSGRLSPARRGRARGCRWRSGAPRRASSAAASCPGSTAGTPACAGRAVAHGRRQLLRLRLRRQVEPRTARRSAPPTVRAERRRRPKCRCSVITTNHEVAPGRSCGSRQRRQAARPHAATAAAAAGVDRRLLTASLRSAGARFARLRRGARFARLLQ